MGGRGVYTTVIGVTMSDNPLTAMKELLDVITPFIDPEKIGEEESAEIMEKAEALQLELANPRILGDVPRRVISSFEDWEERVFDVVEVVRPDGTFAQFKIQSVTAAEQRSWKARRDKVAPIQPQPRSKGDGPDLKDQHYIKEMREYENKMIEMEDYSLLYILEAGLVDIKIPGKSDKQKLKALKSKVGGDWIAIGNAIMEISNLTPEILRPF